MMSAPMPSAPPPMPTELPVPLATLAQPDDQERLQNPGQGDVVQLQVEATVLRIEGDTAFIQPKAINGQTLETAPPEAGPDMSLEAQEAGLREAMG